uniref:Uncharacterized protein n=1 Tax=Acrobeloides nanus TaxID=290746 RepID=A0A914CC95_9BILA
MFFKLCLILIFALGIQAVSRSKVLERAKCWSNKHVPYSQAKYAADCDTGKKYRTDCSGYVSLAWNLPSSYTTRTLPNVCSKINKSELKAGDVVLAPGSHVILFEKWTDNAKTKYLAYEQTPKTGAAHHIVTWGSKSMGSTNFYPCRYKNIDN